ncbi:MAG: NAD+ synthase [Planctomycetes bacterium]|nr:NAD+ synthase [Planctomycetota bacterium]
MKIALAQINTTVGDIGGNTERILRNIDRARGEGAALVVFPELTVFGYPPKDLLLRRDLVSANVAAITRIADHCRDITAVVGYVGPDPPGTPRRAGVGKPVSPFGAGTGVFNAAVVCRDGKILGDYAKMLLPTYDVFDESRYFNAGPETGVVSIPEGKGGEGLSVGLSICEDLWNDHQFDGRSVYNVDPIALSVEAGARLLVNLSASPYRAGAQRHREELFSSQIREHGVPLIYVNQVGGNDDLLFDGASLAIDAQGTVVARAKAFTEDFLVVDMQEPSADRQADSASSTGFTGRIEPYPERIDGVHRALVLGVRDYLRKCGFSSAVIGLSGGIDSAVTGALAVEALGADSVHGVAMPSRYSSDHSVEDAKRLAQNLGIRFSLVPIESAHQAMEKLLAPEFTNGASWQRAVAEENVQARIRGNILMALSNESGSLLLTTGNKSELAVGYCTLYGDMCGGLAVLSDVPKTVVYDLARHINASSGRDVIPQRTITKEPSAELKPDQCDQDTLPPYDVLDSILERYVEREESIDEIVEQGFDRDMVSRIAKMVDRNEYKRKQAAIGLKVTTRAFGTGRRMPIAAKFHP